MRTPAIMATLMVTTGLTTGCATFTAVRSAEVSRGPAVTIQGSASTTVGDEAGWFYGYDCASSCDRPVAGVDLGFAQGIGGDVARTAIGFGVSGVFPYVEVYRQLGFSGRAPFGIGGRLGIPFTSWAEHRLYGRVDLVTSGAGSRFMWNPGLVVTAGQSPNGENTGTLLGVANGFGLEVGQGRVVFAPSLSVVTARASHRSYGQQHGPGYSTFATAAMSVTFRREREARFRQ
jgi:hypothetical protein